MLDNIRRVLFGIRALIAIVVAVPCLLMVGAFAVFQFFRGSGTVHVVPSPGETVMVSIDQGPAEPVGPMQHWRRDVPQGAHTVTVSGPLGVTQMPLDVSNGFFSGLVPSSPSQCWAELDATHFYFGNARVLPTVLNRYPSTASISVGGDYLSESELPASIDDRSTVRMLVPMSCGIMGFDDLRLLTELGYSL